MSTILLKFGDMRFPLRLGETLIGRSPYCSIVIADPRISRQHAAIRVTADAVRLQDLSSHNGTFVNGKRISGVRELAAGDVIEVGEQRLVLEVVSGAAVNPRRPLAETGDYGIARDAAETPTEPGAPPSLRSGTSSEEALAVTKSLI